MQASTKIQALSGQLKNPFSSGQSVYAGFSNSFNQYRSSFESNLQWLKRKFANEDPNKIKDLLEELDNNVEMVTSILATESQDKQPMLCEKPTPKKPEHDDENRMLKNAIARLYKRMLQQEKDLEQVRGSLQRTKRENEELKLQNRLLLEKEFGNNCFEEERAVF